MHISGKMGAILIMEADFNYHNGTIYGSRMLDVARQFKFMPEEIFSKQGKTADDGSLVKILIYDTVRQSQCMTALSSIDAANCYDSIVHAIASLVFQSFGVPVNAVESMITTIQEMKSKSYKGSTIMVEF